MGTFWATKSMAVATRRCGAAGLSANGEAQRQRGGSALTGMLSPKRGCAAPRGMLSVELGCSAPRGDAQHPGVGARVLLEGKKKAKCSNKLSFFPPLCPGLTLAAQDVHQKGSGATGMVPGTAGGRWKTASKIPQLLFLLLFCSFAPILNYF